MHNQEQEGSMAKWKFLLRAEIMIFLMAFLEILQSSCLILCEAHLDAWQEVLHVHEGLADNNSDHMIVKFEVLKIKGYDHMPQT